MTRKIYCINCKKYKEFKKPKISYICYKRFFLSSICKKCGSEDEKYLKKKNQLRYQKLEKLGLIEIL